MKYFLRLADAVRRRRVCTLHRAEDPVQRFWSEVDYKQSGIDKIIEACQPFVFASGFDWNLNNVDQVMLGDNFSLDSAPPFRTFSIEVLNGFFIRGEYGGYRCILIHEAQPMKFVFFVLYEGIDGDLVIASSKYGAFVDKFLDRLSKDSCGIERVKEKIKIGSGNDKRIHTIRKVIYICPTKSQSHFGTREITWAQRWQVRGHWRKTDTIGKNRDGIYNVEGFTWVTEHFKGPEDAPMISKVRFVKEQEPLNNV